jgi:hypothetical protein
MIETEAVSLRGLNTKHGFSKLKIGSYALCSGVILSHTSENIYSSCILDFKGVSFLFCVPAMRSWEQITTDI